MKPLASIWLFWCLMIMPAPLGIAADIRVFATSNIGTDLKAEIHLYHLGSHDDSWPVPHAQSATNVKPGYYQIEVSLPGFRSYKRDVEILNESNDIRAVLTPSEEAAGRLVLSGRVTNAKTYEKLWVLAFPLTGNPSDSTQAMVNSGGAFRVVTTHPGAYVLVVVSGERMLGCTETYIGADNAEVVIRVTE
jgi:hypothetical protein